MKASGKLVCLLFLLLLLAVAEETPGQQAAFYLQDGDRVLFYGDSITESNPYYAGYPVFVESFVVTRFPRLHIGFTNAGWAGDMVGWGPGGTVDERLRRDVFPNKPTVVSIMFGMNDGFYEEFKPASFKIYSVGYERLLALLKADSPRLRITLLQPSPFDDFTASGTWRLAPPPIKDGYNSVLVRYGEFVKDLARRHDLNIADMNAPLVAVLQKAITADPTLAQKIIPDRIHPAAAGHLVIAIELLKAWHASPLVSAVELDTSANRVVRTENTKVKELKSGAAISWTQYDEALPMPLDMKDPMVAFVVKLSDVEGLNQQLLKVNGLRASSYALKIDGTEVGTWTSEQLAAGINLAFSPTPMLKQAMAVYALTLQHNRIHFVRGREVQIPLKAEQASPVTRRTVAALDTLEAELIRQQRATAQPQVRHYALIEKAN